MSTVRKASKAKPSASAGSDVQALRFEDQSVTVPAVSLETEATKPGSVKLADLVQTTVDEIGRYRFVLKRAVGDLKAGQLLAIGAKEKDGVRVTPFQFVAPSTDPILGIVADPFQPSAPLNGRLPILKFVASVANKVIRLKTGRYQFVETA